MLKIGVISDVHGNLEALENVIDDMHAQGVSEYIVLGDILFWGDEPQKCFERIAKLNPMVWLKGNTDDWLEMVGDNFSPSNANEERIYEEYKRVAPLIDVTVRNYIVDLPLVLTVELGGYSFLCVHGSDRSYNEAVGIMTERNTLQDIFNRMNTDFMLCGHTHRQYIASDIGKTILNVGSVGLSVNKPASEYLILKLDDKEISYEFRRIGISKV